MSNSDDAKDEKPSADLHFEVIPQPSEDELDALIAALLLPQSVILTSTPPARLSRWTRTGRLKGLARRTRPLDSGWKRS